MFTNYKKHHPNYQPFLQENQFGLKLMMDAIMYAFKKYDEFTASDIQYFNVGNRDSEKVIQHIDKWAVWLNQDVRDQILNFINKKEYLPTEWKFIRDTHYNQGEYEFHIHGLLKLGDLSKTDLDDDIEMFHSNNNNELRTDLFDYTKAICVGLFFKKDGYGYNLSPEDARHVHFSIDVSDVLIRMLNQNKFKNDYTQIIEGIARCIFNKMIKWELIKFNMFKIIYDNSSCIKLSERPVYNIPGSDLIRLLIVYKYYYDMINGIISSSSDYKSLDDHLDAINYQMQLMGFSNGQYAIMNSVHNKISNQFLNEKRIVDQDIDVAFDLCRFMLKDSYVVNPSGKVSVNNLVDNRGKIAFIKNEDIGVESSLGIYKLFTNYFENIMSFDVTSGVEEAYYKVDESLEAGTEDVNISANYEEFVKKDRSYLLLQFNSSEKKTFIKYENEVMRLRGDVSNCRTKEMQAILIDRAASLSERINLEATKSVSEKLVAGLILLDTYRGEITNQLASIDFDKRRKGMLYGVIKTKTNFDY